MRQMIKVIKQKEVEPTEETVYESVSINLNT